MMNIVNGAGVDQQARRVASLADAKAQAASDVVATLGSLATQDSITVSQLQDPENLHISGMDPSEVTCSPLCVSHIWNGSSFEIAAAPAKARSDNLMGLAAAMVIGNEDDPANGGYETVVGVEGYHFDPSWGTSKIDVMPTTSGVALTVGDTVDFWFIYEDRSAAVTDYVGENGPRVKTTITDGVNTDGFDCRLFINTSTFTLETAPGSWDLVDDVTVNGTLEAIDLGSGVFLMHVGVVAAADATMSLQLQVDAGGSSATTAEWFAGPVACYVNETFDHDAGDDTAKLVLPNGAASELGLTADAHQKATVDGQTLTLALPSAPAAGTVAEYMLRATIQNGGSLALPSSNVTTYGDAGPFSTSALIGVRHYDDDTADIVARGS